MSDVISMIGGALGFLNSTIILGNTLLNWLCIGVLFGLIGAFLRGKK